MKRRIAILGSTGSIGRQTLEVVAALADDLEVIALGGGENLELLRGQAARFRPRYLASPALRRDDPELDGRPWQLIGLEEMAVLPEADLVVIATVGLVGLAPTVAAVRAGKTVALANKEALVVAGELLVDAARATGAEILPIDSEHSAIWQCLVGEGSSALLSPSPGVARLLLTASGGPFRDLNEDTLAQVTPAQALLHPTWDMGPKVTVDSATLMNKGLEVIEAHWLFALPYDRVEVIMHRQSIVHSLVEFVDGSLKAQLAVPDMRVPIQHALTFPRRVATRWPRLDLVALRQLTFEEVDERRYPCLRLARQAGESGGTYPAVLSAADEVAVAAFLAGQIGFLDIPRLVEGALEKHANRPAMALEDIFEADDWARQCCRGLAMGVT